MLYRVSELAWVSCRPEFPDKNLDFLHLLMNIMNTKDLKSQVTNMLVVTTCTGVTLCSSTIFSTNDWILTEQFLVSWAIFLHPGKTVWEEMGRVNTTSLAQWNPYKVVRSVSSLTLPLEGGNTAKVKEFYAEDFFVISPTIYLSWQFL